MTLAEMLNVPREIEYQGKVYRVRQPNQFEQGEFQVYLEQCAYDAIERRVYQDEEQKREDRHKLNIACGLGEFEWGGYAATVATQTPARLWKLLTIICREDGMTPEIAKGFINDKLREIALALIQKSTDDPKALAGALAALGFPPDYLSGNSSSHSATPRSEAPQTSAL